MKDNREHDRRRLFKLRDLNDYKVSDDDPDVRGWQVVDRDNQKVGEVAELIVNPAQRRVKYLEVAAVNSLSSQRAERHMLIPIGMAVIDEEDDTVRIPEIAYDTLTDLPDYSGEEITPDYENDVVTRLRRPGESAAAREDFDEGSDFDERKFYSPRKRSVITREESNDSIRKKRKE